MLDLDHFDTCKLILCHLTEMYIILAQDPIVRFWSLYGEYLQILPC